MSLVLAFGLSPLGQVPAYATTGDGSPAAALQPMVTTYVSGAPTDAKGQFGEVWITDTVLNKDYRADLKEAEWTEENQPVYAGTTQRYLKFDVYDTSGGVIRSGGSTGKTDEEYIEEYAVTLTGPDGKKIKAETTGDHTGEYAFGEAGTYTVEIVGDADGDYAHRSIETSFKVFPYDISELVFVADVSSMSLTYLSDLVYTGKDRAMKYKLATTTTNEFDPDYYTAADITKANYDAKQTSNPKIALSAGDIAGLDAKYKIVTDAGSYDDATVTGTGNLTGTAAAPFDVARVPLLVPSSDKAALTSVVDSTHDAVAVTYVSPGVGRANVNVSAGKVNKPIELKYYIGNGTPAIAVTGAEYVTLEEGVDYTVTYYNDGTLAKKLTELPTDVNSTYVAVIKLAMNSTNFQYVQDSANTITASCKVVGSGSLDQVAKTGTLTSGTYLGGASAAADPKAGGKFYAADGTDVTDLVGTNFTVNPDFKIASSNTAKTARTSNGDKKSTGNPLGAGTYTGTITGATAYTGGGNVDVTYVVEPRVAKEGTGKGDLAITIQPGAYKGGDYVDMDEGSNVKVEMYTSDNGKSTVEVDSTGYSALDDFSADAPYKNWTVKYYKADGQRVSLPSDAGEYTAVFSFDGNLAGTPDIEKKFTVGKGDASTLVSAIRDKGGDTGTYNGKTTYLSDPELTFTGSARPLDKKNLVLVDDNGVEIDENKLVGTDYELTYAAGGSGASLDADGNPLTSGVYAVTATFSGNYEGSVATTLTIDKLSLRNLTAAASVANTQAEIQYEVADGVWDTEYSAVATGEPIVPAMRIALLDGNEKKASPTLVDESVYTAKFTDNDKKGSASVTITSGSSSVQASSAAQAQAFSIGEAGKDLTGATVALADKDGAAVTGIKYGQSDWQLDTAAQNYLTVKTNLSGAPVVFGTSTTEYGTATVQVNQANVPVYTTDDADAWYTRAQGVYAKIGDGTTLTAAGYTFTGGSEELAETANADGLKKVTNAKKNGSDVTDLYKVATAGTVYDKDSSATLADNYYTLETDPAYTLIAATAVASTVATTSDYKAGEATAAGDEITKSVATNTASFDYEGVALYKRSDGKYYAAAEGGTALDDAYTYTDTLTGQAKLTFPLFVSAGPIGNNYSVRVVNASGKDVTSNFNVVAGDDPYTTVKVQGTGSATTGYQYGFGSAPAGEYTIVVGAGTAQTYAGRAVATFTVEKMNISDAEHARILYHAKDSDGQMQAYTLTQEWAVDYDAAAAGTVKGIMLAAEKATNADDAYFTVEYDGASLKEGNAGFTVAYTENKAAGTAKVTFTGKGNYTGTVEKPFTINRAKLDAPGTNKSGFVVNWLESKGFEYDKNANGGRGAYVAAYTGLPITPEFEVNLYEEEDAVTPKGMLQEDYTVTWSNNTHVSYDYNGTNVSPYAKVKITATGNYEGSIEGTFQINPTDLYNNSAVTVSPVSDQVWTGRQIIPAVNVTLNGTALTQGTDYVVTLAAGDNGTDEGEHTALIASAGKGDTTVSTPIEVKYNIKKASEITYDLTGATVALSGTQFTYNGKAQAPTVTGVTLKDGTLLDAALYTATIPSATGANTYTVSVKGATASVTGAATATFTIAKAANTLTVKAKSPSIKASKVKSKKGTIKATKAFNVKKNVSGGKVTYKKTSGSKKVKVSSTGKVTVKKGTKKGTYTVKVKATSKATANYTAKTTAAFKLKVKVK